MPGFGLFFIQMGKTLHVVMGKGDCGKQKKKEKSERKSSFAFVGVPCLLASVGPPRSPRGIALTKATALNNGNLDSQNPGLWATN